MSEPIPEDVRGWIEEGFPEDAVADAPKYITDPKSTREYRKMMQETDAKIEAERKSRVGKCMADIDRILRIYNCRMEPQVTITPSGTRMHVVVFSNI